TWRPTLVDPVKLTSATRRSSTNRLASELSDGMKSWKMGGSFSASITSLQMRCTAIEQSGGWCDGFQTLTSPQAAAMKAVQDQTATGKLNAEMIPITPSGCHCSYIRWRGRSECIDRP